MIKLYFNVKKIKKYFFKSSSSLSQKIHIIRKYINTKIFRSSHRSCSVRKCVLKNFTIFTGKHLCQSLFFNKVAGLRLATLLKLTLAQVFSCEFCEISKNTLFYRKPPVAASETRPLKLTYFQQLGSFVVSPSNHQDQLHLTVN